MRLATTAIRDVHLLVLDQHALSALRLELQEREASGLIDFKTTRRGVDKTSDFDRWKVVDSLKSLLLVRRSVSVLAKRR
jgi:hypothetical protein